MGADHKDVVFEGGILCPSVGPGEHLARQSQCAMNQLGS